MKIFDHIRNNWYLWSDCNNFRRTRVTFDCCCQGCSPSSLWLSRYHPSFNINSTFFMSKLLNSSHNLEKGLNHWHPWQPFWVTRVIEELFPSPSHQLVLTSWPLLWVVREYNRTIWNLKDSDSDSLGVSSELVDFLYFDAVDVHHWAAIFIAPSEHHNACSFCKFYILWDNNNDIMTPHSSSWSSCFALIQPFKRSDIENSSSVSRVGCEC
jgi:hypothetical protein